MVFQRLDEFVEADEPDGDSLVTFGDGETVMGGDSNTMIFGDSGTGKTSKTVDLAAHFASGQSWLGLFEPTRPLRVALLENEGSRAQFRKKLQRKEARWDGPSFLDNIFVYAEPWGQFTFESEGCRVALAAFLAEHAIDLLIAGPLAELGAAGAGTPDDVSEFASFVQDVRARVGRPLAVCIVHHENKGGLLSGAWSRWPDVLVQVRQDGRERSTLHIRKSRLSSQLHGARLGLRWLTDTDGYEVTDSDLGESPSRPRDDNPNVLKWLTDYVTEQHAATGVGVPRGKAETAYHEAHGNHGRNLARRVIDRQIVLAADTRTGEATGEHFSLAVGPGEVTNGTYLFPFADAPSPLADTLNGEGGEAYVAPDARRSPPPIEEGAAARRVTGEHTETINDELAVLEALRTELNAKAIA